MLKIDKYHISASVAGAVLGFYFGFGYSFKKNEIYFPFELNVKLCRSILQKPEVSRKAV